MNFVLMEAGAQQPQGGGFISMIFPFALMFFIFYFLIIRPQKKKQKEHVGMLDNLQINDKVLTNGGIIGKIVNIKKDKNIIVIRVDETTNTKIEVQKTAIAAKLENEEKTA